MFEQNNGLENTYPFHTHIYVYFSDKQRVHNFFPADIRLNIFGLDFG